MIAGCEKLLQKVESSSTFCSKICSSCASYRTKGTCFAASDATPVFGVIPALLGILRNHDDDGNENVKKNRFNEQNNNPARATRFLVHFFAFTAQLRLEMTKF